MSQQRATMQARIDMGMVRADTGKVVRVDATTSTGGRAFDDGNAHAQPTCFGFWRKKKAKPLPVQPATQAAPSQPATQEEDAKDTPRSRQKSPRGMFGASSILRSFQAIGIDMMSEPTSARRKHDPRECFQGGNTLEDDPSKILASYSSNIYETKPDFCETQALDGDLDAEDGADSIEEEEADTFGTPSWTVDPHDIYFVSRSDGSGKICRLGKGDYGPVYLGVWQEHEVAIKLAKQKPITLKQERRFQAQVARAHALSHPNLVQFMGACCWKGGKRSVLVTEYMDKGDLRKLLGREDLTAKFAWVRYGRTVALDVAQGLAYLHARGIVHGRMKSSNVLMNKAGVAKICDVALAEMLSHCKDARIDRTSASQLPTNDASIAPEVGAGAEPSMASDIYAFGVILWELLSMETPACNLRPIRTPEEAPAVIAYLVECCLAKDPKKRPTAAKIVSIIHGKQ